MEINPIDAYAVNRVNDVNGVRPMQETPPDSGEYSWSGMTTSEIRAQTRAMENEYGLGNRVDIYA